MAAMFAATYPQRVSAVVLGGLWLKALAGRPETLTPDPDMAKLLADRIGPLWRQGALAEVLAPSYADDQRFRSWWRRWEVYSATPAAAAGLLSWAATFDPAPILPAIQAPTLVLERAVAYHDQESRRLAAAQIPGARFVLLPGADALPYLGDADAALDEVEEFLTGARGTAVSDRSLATVLFTDIAGSTDRAGRLGDRRWRYPLEDHHAHVRRLLERFRGVEVDTAGDGFFATFDGPARAIRCACAIRDAVADLGIEIRAGLHTGEVERRGGEVTGLAVHVGARVAALAGASEVLVTSTVQMLVLGSGIGFADRGTTPSREFPTGGTCSPWNTPDQPGRLHLVSTCRVTGPAGGAGTAGDHGERAGGQPDVAELRTRGVNRSPLRPKAGEPPDRPRLRQRSKDPWGFAAGGVSLSAVTHPGRIVDRAPSPPGRLRPRWAARRVACPGLSRCGGARVRSPRRSPPRSLSRSPPD
jgi:class 3 adenylate cyclase